MFRETVDNHPDGDREAVHDNSHECDRDQIGPPAPATESTDPGSTDKKRRWLTDLIRKAFNQQSSEIRAILAEGSNRSEDEQSYLEIVAACQRDTAEFANHVLERHALYPAVETVDLLTSLIHRLEEQAVPLAETQIRCPLFGPLLDSVAEAAKVAQSKREYLDMGSIHPQPLDDFEVEKHEIRQTLETDDPSQHKRIGHTLVPGLSYRGDVLRRAKVSVYRYIEKNSDIERKRP